MAVNWFDYLISLVKRKITKTVTRFRKPSLNALLSPSGDQALWFVGRTLCRTKTQFLTIYKSVKSYDIIVNLDNIYCSLWNTSGKRSVLYFNIRLFIYVVITRPSTTVVVASRIASKIKNLNLKKSKFKFFLYESITE